MVTLLAVAACHHAPPAPQPPAQAKADLIPCAQGGAPLASVCAVELAPGGIVIVRNPDGGFHRLHIAGGGRGVVAADGATPTRVTVVDGGTIEVAIAGDRYRLPATVAR